MLSIGSFSKTANITTKTLRFYDEIGLLKPAQVDSDTGYRYYDVAQLESVLLIGRLKAYDFSLDEIAQVLKNPRDNALILPAIEQKKSQIEGMALRYADTLKRMNDDIASLERGDYIMSYLESIAVKLIETQPMNLLSIREKMNVHDTGKYIGALYQRIAEEKLTPVGPPMTILQGEEFSPECYDMEIAVPVKEVVKGTRGFPSYLCAHASLKGNYSEMPSVYSKLREWMEQEGYVMSEAPFEMYMTDPAQTPPDENITEVYCPVKKQ